MIFFYIFHIFSPLIFQAERKGLVMVNFFSYFLTCSNHSTLNDVIGESECGVVVVVVVVVVVTLVIVGEYDDWCRCSC